jgi:DNA-binding LacI/PurR family transcriptional regulator
MLMPAKHSSRQNSSPKRRHVATSGELGPVRFEGLVEILRQQIVRGVLLPGERLPTFTDMQSQFGTTPSTVNRALITLEQEGLIVRERRRGVFVAEQHSRAKQHAIGLTGFDTKVLQSSYWVHLLEGIQEAVHGADMETVLLKPRSTRGLDRIDALLVHGRDEEAMPCIAPLMPRVSLMENWPGCSSVLSDDFEGTRLATQHLLELGHRKIACLHYLNAPVNQQRLAGYRYAMQNAGIAVNDKWIRDLETTDLSSLREIGRHCMVDWLASDWGEQGCTAILCQNDVVAVGVIQALREFGLDVPRDVSVIGYDGTEEGEYCTPHLTSVQIPLQQIGKTAVELLLSHLHQKPDFPISITLPVRLIIRESTAPHPL